MALLRKAAGAGRGQPKVCLACYSGWGFSRSRSSLARARSLAKHVMYAAAAGFLGSVWWWTEVGPWYFSAIHGAIWGALVGVAAWTARGADIVEMSVVEQAHAGADEARG